MNSLCPRLESQIQSLLRTEFDLEINQERDLLTIAASIRQMSDYYISNPGQPTPWQHRWCQIAQLAYYLPLNYLRAQRVWTIAEQIGFLSTIREVVDFGSGLGIVRNHPALFAIECSKIARMLARKLDPGINYVSAPVARPNTLLVMSYAMNELNEPPPWLEDFEWIFIIEPSTQEAGRRLMQLRQTLLEKKFFAWGPCTHQLQCPLLTQSKKDWCHDRIPFARPDWWLKMEKHLPFKNATLTLSYLLMAKSTPPPTSQVRVVGDPLPEKGKVRQMICRGPEREFVAWLTRNGMPPVWPRGALVDLASHQKKGNELQMC